MVEYAITRLMSGWTTAMVAAKNAVKPPIPTIASWSVDVKPMNTLVMASRYTPAATIVASWMSAETVVGPSIASGSQTWSGNWALLPAAPPRIMRPAIVSSAEPPPEVRGRKGELPFAKTKPFAAQPPLGPVVAKWKK